MANKDEQKDGKRSKYDVQQLEQRVEWKLNLTLALLFVIISVLVYNQRTTLDLLPSNNRNTSNRPTAWLSGDNLHHGYLEHVIKLFKQIGFDTHIGTEPPESGKWDVLWSHNYPFVQSFKLPNLEPNQKVNHFPGSGFITNKVTLATSGLKYVPKSFNLPREKETFLKYATEHPEKLWVQKNNDHRGIKVKTIAEMNLEQVGTFVQEYIQNPLLIDGKKFDIGLYVTATSINPLRVYVYDNDVLLRFCHQPYYPFNVTNLDTYVVGNLYTPIWDMPSLKPYFIDLNMNTKQSFNGYIRNVLGKDPATIWSQMEESIKTIFYTKQDQMIKYTEMFPSGRNFFEMVRFDFTLDEDLNVFLMEANMSPNLASAKFPPNRLIYEPVIYSLFSLTGLVRIPQIPNWATIPSNTEWDMLLLEKDLSVLSDVCSNPDCHFRNETSSGCETVDHCDVCYHCLSEQLRLSLKDAYLEEHSKWHNKRLIPSTSVEAEVVASVNDYLQEKWFIGKCLQDSRWCN